VTANTARYRHLRHNIPVFVSAQIPAVALPPHRSTEKITTKSIGFAKFHQQMGLTTFWVLGRRINNLQGSGHMNSSNQPKKSHNAVTRK
jgi:hypothetical protein